MDRDSATRRAKAGINGMIICHVVKFQEHQTSVQVSVVPKFRAALVVLGIMKGDLTPIKRRLKCREAALWMCHAPQKGITIARSQLRCK